MKIIEMIKTYLIVNEFDGLFNEEDECGCLLDDLFPCTGDFDPRECEPGYKLPGNEECDFLVGPKELPFEAPGEG